MTRVLLRLLVFVVGASVVSAQDSSAPQFRFERAITSSAGRQRLSIDVPLLVGSQPFAKTTQLTDGSEPRMVAVGGLGDLRLFDASGRDVPYLLVSPELGEARVVGRVLPIAPENV